MNLFKSTLIATALVAAGFAGTANAATATSNFQAKIVITESCAFSTTGASDVDFGTKARSAGGNEDDNGTLVVNCTTGTPYAIGLDQGTYGSSVTSRLMKHATGTATIPYSLYRDAAMTQNWGDAAGATQPGVGNGSDQTVQVYGRVLGSSNVNVPAGDYADTITATITY